MPLHPAEQRLRIANAPGLHESTSAGEPQRVSPISACSRAISVEICSGDGSGRVSSENCTTRAGVGIDGHDDAIDGAGGGMRFEIEQRQRAQRARIAHRRRQLQRPLVHVARRRHVVLTRQSRTCSTAAPRPRRSRCAERLQQPAEHERQRLEPLDRPLEIERLLEALLGHRRHERSGVLAAREPLPPHTGLPEPRRDVVGRQRRQIAQRAQAPAAERLDEFVARPFGSLGVGSWTSGSFAIGNRRAARAATGRALRLRCLAR